MNHRRLAIFNVRFTPCAAGIDLNSVCSPSCSSCRGRPSYSRSIFWPPKIVGKRGFGDEECRFHAERGWPFVHLSAWSRHYPLPPKTPVDSDGWPLAQPPPPRVTNWNKLAANVIVLSAIASIAWWIARWLWDICRAATKLRRESDRRHMIKLFAFTAILCLIGFTIVAWGVVTRHHSYHAADLLLTWGYDQDIPSRAYMWLLLPPLFMAAGILILAAARDWLQGSDRKVRMTMIACATTFLLVVFWIERVDHW